MKVLCLIPSLQIGGMERVMSQLLKHFASKSEVEVHLILYGINREIFYPIFENVNLHRPHFTFNDHYRFWYTLKTLWFVRQKVKELQPNTILSFGELWNNFVLLALLGTSFPVYVSDRCQPNKSLGKIQDRLRQWLYPKAAGIIAQTKQAKDIYTKIFYHPRIEVIGNPILQIIEDKSIQKENIVLSVGRLINTKHHDQLIKLFVTLNYPDWKLVIVGSDALKQDNTAKLKTLVRGLGAEDRVILTGQQPNIEIYYQKSKIFAFTSSSEGFPNVIGEALSAGLPVVAFDCVAGPSDMIKDGQNGYLVDLFDYDTFKRRLVTLMDNENLRNEMAAKARTSITSFEEFKISERVYQFITATL